MDKTETGYSRMLWRFCNLCMCIFFTLATYVQINDPDAVLWMVGYAIPGSLCLMISFKPNVTEVMLWKCLANLHLIICSAVVAMLGWTLYRQRDQDIFQQEEGREFSGLMITALWLLLCRDSGRGPIGAVRLITAVALTLFPFVTWLYYYLNEELRSAWPSHCKTAL
uniref:Transmembrane protein 220 n=1 Tax=Paramormyrops kingsleyae TaxID=1676925 RepID=A0A3B3T003_9TELE